MVRRWLRLFDTRQKKNTENTFILQLKEWYGRWLQRRRQLNKLLFCVCCPKLFRPLNSFEKLIESVGASTPIVLLIHWICGQKWVSIPFHGDQFICDASVAVKTEIKSDEQKSQQWNQKTQIRNAYNWWRWDSHPYNMFVVRGLFIRSDINSNIISDLNEWLLLTYFLLKIR